MASAPGHPILADAIETIINQVRNKFTSVDIDERYCPNPDTKLLHKFDMLFASGPCLLGASINRALGRPKQKRFGLGDQVQVVSTGQPLVPGRTLILDRKRGNGTEFVLPLPLHLTLAATDLPTAPDKRRNKRRHYFLLSSKTTIFGEKGLYANDHKANEDIRIIVPYQ